MTAGKIQQHIRIEVQGGNGGVKPGDGTVERLVTLKNRGQQRAAIDLWLKPNDASSEPLLQWCSWVPSLPVSLDADTQCEIILQFDIPQTAEPRLYTYAICAEAPQYPGEVIQRPQQLQVLASEQYLEARNEPVFTLDPQTSSEKPFQLAVGETLQVTVQVENRSRQTDRFFLSCPELMASWFDITYPDNITQAGTGVQTEGLPLNPGETGSIRLSLHPPSDTLAGHYFSTVRLKSSIRLDLVFLDVVYFTLGVDDRLSCSLSPTTALIAASTETFAFTVTNSGNVQRWLEAQAQDEAALFTYRFKPQHVQLIAGETATFDLTVKPRKWWRRTWQGAGQEIPFAVELLNAPPQEADQRVDVMEPMVETFNLSGPTIGTLIWKPRPTLLILAFLVVLLLGAFLGLSYWALWQFLVKPSLLPKVADFATAQKTYQDDGETPVRLNWTIQNIGQLKQVRVVRVPDVIDRQTDVQVDPKSQPKLTLQEENQTSSLESLCKLEMLPSKNFSFKPLWQFLYQYKPEIELDRQYENQAIQCRGVPTQVKDEGNYEFKLDVFAQPLAETPEKGQPDQGQSGKEQNVWQALLGLLAPKQADKGQDASKEPKLTLADSKTLKDVIVAPITPAILIFASKVPAYREPELAGTSSPTSGGIKPTSQLPIAPIKLNWTVAGAKKMEALELKVVKVGLNGFVATTSIRYPMSNGIPVALESRCRPQKTLLLCEDVVIDAKTAGQYTFSLSAILLPGQTVPSVNRLGKNAAPIQIKPPLPEIRTFTVNGQDAIENPKQIFTVSPARGVMEVTLAWNVPQVNRMKVELLPAPGVVQPAQSGKLKYSLSPNAGSTTLTLRVTNQVGEVVERAVILETAPFVPSSQSPTLPPPPPPADGSAPGSSPSGPSNPQELPPFELPPKAN